MSDWKSLDGALSSLYTTMADERKQNKQQVLGMNKLMTAWGLAPETTTILDAACGNGVRTMGLYELGWKNQAVSDGAEQMIQEMKDVRDKAGAKFPVELMDWTTLGDQCRATEGFKQPFDVAMIVGCSLIMMETKHYQKLFHDLFALVKPGGRFVFDTRDWIEKDGMVQQPGAPHGEKVLLGEYPMDGVTARVSECSTYGPGTQRKVYDLVALDKDGKVQFEKKEGLVFNLNSCMVTTMIQMLETAGFKNCEVHTRGSQGGDESAASFTDLGYIYCLVSAQRPLA